MRFRKKIGPTVLTLASGLLLGSFVYAQGDRSDSGLMQAESTLSGGLSQDEAKQYMLELINRDRQSNGLRPVTYDHTASQAGQGHSDEMAQYGYLSHWALSGAKPDERYTEAGGTGFDMENAHLSSHAAGSSSSAQRKAKLPIPPGQLFEKKQLEFAESLFINEKPPMDGHRKNILDPNHTAVGIGISSATDNVVGRFALTQEFVNNYADLAPIPASISRGEHFIVSGKLAAGARIYGIDLMQEPLPSPLSVEELNHTGSYPQPTNRIASYWPNRSGPEAIQTGKEGDREVFQVEIATGRASWLPGLYYVWVWAKTDPHHDPFLISGRTILVK